MLQIVKGHLSKLSNYPRLRVLLIIVAIIVVFVIAINLLRPASLKNQSPPSSVQSVNTSGGKQQPAPSNQQAQYQQLNAANQTVTDKQTIQAGGSVIQDAFNPNQASGQSNPSGPSSTKPANPDSLSPEQFASAQNTPPASTNKSTDDSQANSPALNKQIATLQQQLAAQQQTNQKNTVTAAQQATQNQMQAVESSMQSGLQNITDSWKLPTLATVQGAPPSGPDLGGSDAAGPVAIKAGSIQFAVIDTALDSDQPGTPVLATIVMGPYKGAKLLGGFTTATDALVVQFNLMSIPSLSSSIGINAYAIDGKTANNAIATNVNNHYLLRYGMLFASAFLQGFGSAYQNSSYCPPGTAQCTIMSTNGNNAPPPADVTTKNAEYQGLGQVGETLGQVAASQFNTPPTITVAQGTGIGVLFMSDVRFSLNQ